MKKNSQQNCMMMNTELIKKKVKLKHKFVTETLLLMEFNGMEHQNEMMIIQKS